MCPNVRPWRVELLNCASKILRNILRKHEAAIFTPIQAIKLLHYSWLTMNEVQSKRVGSPAMKIINLVIQKWLIIRNIIQNRFEKTLLLRKTAFKKKSFNWRSCQFNWNQIISIFISNTHSNKSILIKTLPICLKLGRQAWVHWDTLKDYYWRPTLLIHDPYSIILSTALHCRLQR